MSNIRDLHNPWRDRMQTASFRDALFKVEIGARQGGRRTVVHQYPKRDLPYAEDMGRSAVRFTVQGYLIGPNYLTEKDALIAALEQDGPGTLRMQWPYQGADIEVMCINYTVTETRERGGMCGIDMDFVEAGKPGFNNVMSDATAMIGRAATSLENLAQGK